MGKRKRRMSKAKVGGGDEEVAELQESISGGRQTYKVGKAKGVTEGKQRKEEVEHRKGRKGKELLSSREGQFPCEPTY